MTTSDVPRAFDSTLFPPNSSTFPSPIDTEDRLNSPQDGPIVELPSTFVESSQSQFEHDLTASHAEMMDARRTALLWGKEEDPSSVPSSSPPRPAESQDYDANDEYSQSQDVPSQPSTFAPSQLYGSPSRSSSQSGSYQGMSYPRTPSQLRHFTDMFRNRDEFGNELPEKPVENGGGTTRSRSMSPSPSSRKKPRLEDLRADTSRTDNPSPYDFLPTSQRSPRHDSDSLEGTSGSPPASQSLVDGYNDGSSSSQELPSAMRDFLAMFDGSQPSQLAFL
ncbi:hypothetical protein C8Q79DRAFT_901713 [Trametes meyenii]|nr:hypothetical protein C8Q79DRAFT_901713 [Trametes meyenii]